MDKKINSLLIGAFIRGLREGSASSQQSMANDLGITQSTLSRIEKGISVPNIILADKIMDWFGVSINSFKDFFGITTDEYNAFNKNKITTTEFHFRYQESISVLNDIYQNNPALTSEQRSKIQKILDWE